MHKRALDVVSLGIRQMFPASGKGGLSLVSWEQRQGRLVWDSLGKGQTPGSSPPPTPAFGSQLCFQPPRD